ncbi:class I SAM-dependent methyltransferase [uncultured Erythrobacter sp.]|uniref:class I SAM-dependent methyltransferase n=1 Tax=uncultured Erythrobacter sp. TaxID=263913 RepID=UPI00260EE969|nr:class I SAM-dependent methyltransferase [uncultured Erythrobacter sp.]
MGTKYDTIGRGYSALRHPDPRIGTAIYSALGDAQSVLNVGAGAGSYEPTDRAVTPVEPSTEMIEQHPRKADVVQASAEDLPFPDKSFDASMAVLTVHHWPDQQAGLREMRRVTRGRIVLLTFDPAFRDIWLLDYLSELAELDDRQMPQMPQYEEWLGPISVTPVPIPHDCTDRFLYAHWRNPEAYLDPEIRKGSSSFWAIDSVEEKLSKLRDDLESREWERRYGHLRDRDELDLGYRLIIAETDLP